MVVRPSEHDRRDRCYQKVRKAGAPPKNGKVELEPCTLEMNGLDERTLEEFYFLRLFLCDFDRLARSSCTVVALVGKEEIMEKLRVLNKQSFT